jgi:mannose-6-phosphate isomerase-like protein (cupin superfamily)
VAGSPVVANPHSYALGPGEGRQIDLGDGFAVAVKADEHGTGGVVSVLETEEPPGFGPPMHVHHDCAEAFYVLEGEYVMYLDEREVVCPAGSFIFIPRGARHGFRTGDTPGRKLNLYFPASMIGYFDDLASALERAGVGDTELAEIAAAHSMEIVGPPSETYV